MLNVIKNQKYQTYDEVKQAASKGCHAATLSSIRHWKELATAPVRDLIANCYPNLGTKECALCIRYFNCIMCPLYEKTGYKCYQPNSPYEAARSPYAKARITKSKVTKDAAIKRFRRAAEKMIRVLESCL